LPVSDVERERKVRQAHGVEGAEKKITRGVAREEPAGSVSAMRGRSESHDHQPRARIAEGGERPGPVLLPPKPPRRNTRDTLPPRVQARAAPAGDHLPLDRVEEARCLIDANRSP